MSVCGCLIGVGVSYPPLGKRGAEGMIRLLSAAGEREREFECAMIQCVYIQCYSAKIVNGKEGLWALIQRA